LNQAATGKAIPTSTSGPTASPSSAPLKAVASSSPTEVAAPSRQACTVVMATAANSTTPR
jgi:hypothetical protein